jgi:hypothetical protein
MALKPGRTVVVDDISYYINTVAERGGVVCQNSAGSSGVTGEGIDSSNRVVAYQTNPSGSVAVGLLLRDIVNKDLSQTHLNQYKSEDQVNSKAYLLIKGTAVTNMWLPQALPSGGAISYPINCYLGGSGLLGVGATLANSGYPVVGKVLSALDSDGYAQVRIDL